MQTRTQADDTLLGDVLPGGDLVPPGTATGRTRAAADPDNVTVSGWQVYDNKGRVVRKYEPLFSAGYAFAPPSDSTGRRLRSSPVPSDWSCCPCTMPDW